MRSIVIERLAPALGAEIGGLDLRRRLDAPIFSLIEDALHTHLVLRFRAQRLSNDELLALSRLFGEVAHDGEPVAGLDDADAAWRCDSTFGNPPPRATVWYALDSQPPGADMCWANTYLAYDTLPRALKVAIAGRSAVHRASDRCTGAIGDGAKRIDALGEGSVARHPLVIAHPRTRKPALFLGRRDNSHVVGMPRDESEALLDALWAHATRPELTFRHVWAPHDVVLWDNRCTLHRCDATNSAAPRIVHRLRIEGPAITAYERAP